MVTKSTALLLEFFRGSLPSSRRQRYGDIGYDWETRFDTTSATVPWRSRLHGLLNSPYQPIPADEFHEIMSSLALDFSQFTFIDIGSGKGRALLLAAELGFRRIIGVELLPELDRIARENVLKLKQRGSQTAIELVCQDATRFAFPSEPSLVFFFNPLPPAALNEVIRNIEASLRQAPRSLYIAYANPVFEGVVANSSGLMKFGGSDRYSIFRARSSD
jgi:SAM-dependent methyltransferase